MKRTSSGLISLAALTLLAGSIACSGSTGTPSDQGGATSTGTGGAATSTTGAGAVGGAGGATTTSTVGSTGGGGGSSTTSTGSTSSTGSTVSASSTSSSSSSSSGDAGAADPCGPTNPAVVPLPVIGAGAFLVTTYGAVGDDKTVNTTALQAALDAAKAAGGGTVTVPAGTFLSGPIVVGNGTRLELAAGAELKMLPMGSWPGTTPFITANDAHDIAIGGSGTIEGQGQAWWNALTATPSLVRPQEVSFSNSQRVQISGIRLQNSPEEHIWVKGDTDVTITGITIETLAVAGQHIPNNTDGVDMDVTGAFFCGNSVADGDNNVVMEGKNIYVAYSTFGVGHGCSIGSITTSGISAVTVDHLTMNGTTAGIRLKSARGRGGLVHDLTYSNVTMTDVVTPIYITSYYPTLPTDPTTDPAQAVTATTPEWENITLTNVTATGSTNAGILFGLPEAKISDVVFDNVQIQAATGMEIYHATGISFTNGSKVTATKAPDVTVYDAAVTGVATTPY